MKKTRWAVHILILFLLVSTVFAATKPIAGWVFQSDNYTTAENATVIVYVNTTFGSVNPCRTLPSIFTASDGSYSTDLGNLKRNDGITDCSGLWATNDPIWAEGDGSTVIPISQGNGTTSGDTIKSGTGLQYLSNMTLPAGPDIDDPIVTSITPPNNTLNTDGKVTLQYNVTDSSAIANCSLLFDSIINQTDASVTKNITQNFTLIQMADGVYNWSVKCIDTAGNQNVSETRILNVSKIGSLIVTLITPTTDTTVAFNRFFEFTAKVTCTGGSCGDVNASLDPIMPKKEKDPSFFSTISNFLKGLLSGNLITGMVTGSLVPTNPTTPFWTNSSNPANATNFSCLANMVEGSSCNTTWFVNASGQIGTVGEFFVYYNSTTYINVSNKSAHINITIIDDVNPLVFNLVPLSNSSYNVSDTIEIGANVTDDINVSFVYANITFPNGTIQKLTLTNGSNHVDIYNSTFTIPYLTGQYNVAFIANDSSNNINNTETTFFVGEDHTGPLVFNLVPVAGSIFNVSNTIEIAANVTDDVRVHTVIANVTFPNGTIQRLTITNASTYINKYNNSFTIPLLLGQYNVTYFANDTSNNINRTESTTFTAVDKKEPAYSNITESPADPATYAVGQFYRFNITWTDNIAIETVTIKFEGTNYTTEVTNIGTTYTFNRTDLAVATYNYTWYSNDTSGNTNQTTETYTVNKAASGVNLTVNGTDGNITIEVGSIINLTGTRITGEGNIKLFQDGAKINEGASVISNLSAFSSLGTFNITVIYEETQNFTASRETHFVTVRDTTNPLATGLIISPNPINQTQSTQINATITDNVEVKTVIAQIILSNGTEVNQTMNNISTVYFTAYNTVSLSHPIGIQSVLIIANDTSGNVNDSLSGTFTVNDITPPSVFGLTPIENAEYNITNSFEIAANVTDNVEVDTAQANLTYPNGTIKDLNIIQAVGTNKYNVSFAAPALPGNYTLSFFANDSSGNINNTETTNFIVLDNQPPTARIVNPLSFTVFYQNDDALVTVIAGDDVNVSAVLVNITIPNGTIAQETLGYHAVDDIYNVTFTRTATGGTYTIKAIVNDTSNNINDTETRDFTIQTIGFPIATLLSPENNAALNETTVTFSCNATDTGGLINMTLYHNISGSFIANQTVNISGTGNKTNFTLTSVPEGKYIWNCQSFDTDSNSVFGVANFTFYVDQQPPSVTNPVPTANSQFNTSTTININATVTDDVAVETVLATITFPNETTTQLTLSGGGSNNIYNGSFTTPSLTGTYNVSYTANDTAGNINNTERTNFTVVDGDNAPTITLDSPADSASTTSTSIEFICSATDDDQLVNTSLYLTDINNQNFGRNQTTSVSGVSNQTNWTLSLSVGSYTWNCLTFDNAGQFSFASANRSLTITEASQPKTPSGGGEVVSGGGGGGCIERWNCTGWSGCINNQQNRICTDMNNCGTANQKPNEAKACEIKLEEPLRACTPDDYDCLDWSACSALERSDDEGSLEEDLRNVSIQQGIEVRSCALKEDISCEQGFYPETERTCAISPQISPRRQDLTAVVGEAFRYFTGIIEKDLSSLYFLVLGLILLLILLMAISRRRYPRIIVSAPLEIRRGKKLDVIITVINNKIRRTVTLWTYIIPNYFKAEKNNPPSIGSRKKRVVKCGRREIKILVVPLDTKDLSVGKHNFAVWARIQKQNNRRKKERFRIIAKEFTIFDAPEKKEASPGIIAAIKKVWTKRLLRKSRKEKEELERKLQHMKENREVASKELKLNNLGDELHLELKSLRKLEKTYIERASLDERIRSLSLQHRVLKQLYILENEFGKKNKPFKKRYDKFKLKLIQVKTEKLERKNKEKK